MGGERVAAYILRAPLSQEKMVDLEEKGEVIYRSGKKGGEKKVFGALDWLAALTAHIPDRGEQMVRYYGWYSNKSRGSWKKAAQEGKSAPADSLVHLYPDHKPKNPLLTSSAPRCNLCQKQIPGLLLSSPILLSSSSHEGGPGGD